MPTNLGILELLPVPVYVTDAEGNITFYNEAAAELWGHRPELGTDKWCGSWRLYWPDGSPMPHDTCPMAVMLKEQRAMPGVEGVAERPDGTRVTFMPFPRLLRDDAGRITGAINALVDVSHRSRADLQAARLAAIVASSDDAIVSKTLEGIVTSWNEGATRNFGYEAAEMIGQPILKIIPKDRHHEEVEILGRLRRGERIEHFETVRQTKSGELIDVSLTVSPLRDRAGTLVGASKIARDITDKRRHEEAQRLLIEELNHRVKNTLATVQAIATQSLRRSADPAQFVSGFTGRLAALARAHDSLVREKMRGSSFRAILSEQVFLGGGDPRISLSGPDLHLDSSLTVLLSLVLHELATNARKYGALSVLDGRLSIKWSVTSAPIEELNVSWVESGVANIAAPDGIGFGSEMIERGLSAQGGEATLEYGHDGVSCVMRVPLHQHRASIAETVSQGRPRVFLIEDEVLIAMGIEADLEAVGYDVIGPLGTVDSALASIASQTAAAAILDCNLQGQNVTEVAAALRAKRIPFVFSTGYGPDSVPQGFGGVPVLTKPFERQSLVTVLDDLLSGKASNVVRLH